MDNRQVKLATDGTLMKAFWPWIRTIWPEPWRKTEGNFAMNKKQFGQNLDEKLKPKGKTISPQQNETTGVNYKIK